MEKLRFVGLDVHVDSIAIAIAEGRGGEPSLLGIFPNDVVALVKRLRRLGTTRCCYEAGPTGFGLQRALTEGGIKCVVVAPSLVPTRAGDHVKTDRRDAAKLARFLRSGDLTEIYIPDSETEALRDLERARDDAKKAERVARHQLGKFLMRHGRRFPGKTTWTRAHLDWARSQQFVHEAQHRVLTDYLTAVEDLRLRVEVLTRAISDIVEKSSLKPLVKALQAFRGISLVSAVTIAAELGDLRRFATAPQLMGYLGLVPSEHSSGNTRKRGRITRAGNGHVRRVLIEAAWAYHFRPAKSRAIRDRSQGVAPGVERIAWHAQERLCGRYRRLIARGKNSKKAVTAVARELAGFIWAVGREEQLLAT
jgi:transposase